MAMIDLVVNVGLWSSGLLMGLVGGPHCVVMCGGACSAIASRCGGQRPGQALVAWQLGRAVAYSAAGAAVASGVGLLAQWGGELAWLRPWWLMLQVAVLALGLWMLWHGRAPVWLAAPSGVEAIATVRPVTGKGSLAWSVVGMPASTSRRHATVGVASGQAATAADGGRSVRSNGRAALSGLGWIALPCGLLHAALLTAALGSTAIDGAMVMASFALGSGLSLWIGPRLWIGLVRWLPARLSRDPAGHDIQRFGPAQATRLAGGLLAIGALWATWHVALGPLVDALCRAA